MIIIKGLFIYLDKLREANIYIFQLYIVKNLFKFNVGRVVRFKKFQFLGA